MQPNEPTQSPAFTPGIANSVPVPTPAPEPVQQPAEPVAPVAQPTQQPVQEPQQFQQPIQAPQEPVQQVQPTEPSQPVQQPAPQQEPLKQLSYDEYLDSLTKDIKPVELPKATDVDKDDPEGLNKFFDDYGKKMIEQARQELQKEQVVQAAEARAWQDVFTKYPEVLEDKNLRDTIHNIRMGEYSRGQSRSPLEVADQLVGALHSRYVKGINDTNVQTHIQESQPLNGGGQPQPQPAVNYEALQEGGRDAAVMQLTQMIEQGKI